MRNRALIWLLLGGGGILLVVVAMVAVAVSFSGGDGADFSFSDRIQVVDIHGTLLESSAIVSELKRYEDARNVRAVLLNIDSPGGGVAASQEIYSEVRRLRERSGKKVVAYISSTGASGAYYAACAADRIITNPGAVIGSIGVIAEWVNYGDLLEWAKLKNIVFKSGEFKDTGAPTRGLTERERIYFQGIIDDMYTQFVEAVATGRKMDISEVRQLADGRIFTGRDAKDKRLVDGIGNLQDAIDATASLAGISGRPNLIHSQRQRVTLLDVLTTTDLSPLIPFKSQSASQIRFQYLWK